MYSFVLAPAGTTCSIIIGLHAHARAINLAQRQDGNDCQIERHVSSSDHSSLARGLSIRSIAVVACYSPIKDLSDPRLPHNRHLAIPMSGNKITL